MFPIPSAIIIKIVIVVAIFIGGYFMGWDGEHKKFVQFKAEVAALGKAQEELNAHTAKLAAVISTGVKDEYEARIAGLHTKYANAGRVCQSNSGSGNVSKNAKPARDAYDPTTDPELIMNCAATTAQLVSLQKWITQQIEAQK